MAIGNILQAIDPPDVERVWNLGGLEDLGKSFAARIKDQWATRTPALAAFSEAFRAKQPEVEAFSKRAADTFGGLAEAARTYDPWSSIGRFRDDSISGLSDFLKGAGDLTRGYVSRNLAGLGYGGRGQSSFQTALTANRLADLSLPVLNTIYGSLPAVSGTVEGSRLANLAQIHGLLGRQLGAIEAPAYRYLTPLQIEQAVNSGDISNMQQLADAVKSSLAGFKQTQGLVGRLGVADEANFKQLTDLAMQVLSMYTGGGLGGLLGGIGGGAGGAAGGITSGNAASTTGGGGALSGWGSGGGRAPGGIASMVSATPTGGQGQFSLFSAPTVTNAPMYAGGYGGYGGVPENTQSLSELLAILRGNNAGPRYTDSFA